MRCIEVKRGAVHPRYPNQLTNWFDKKEDLDCYLEAFIRYNDEKYGIIVNSPEGWAIFTKGERIVPCGKASLGHHLGE